MAALNVEVLHARNAPGDLFNTGSFLPELTEETSGDGPGIVGPDGAPLLIPVAPTPVEIGSAILIGAVGALPPPSSPTLMSGEGEAYCESCETDTDSWSEEGDYGAPIEAEPFCTVDCDDINQLGQAWLSQVTAKMEIRVQRVVNGQLTGDFMDVLVKPTIRPNTSQVLHMTDQGFADVCAQQLVINGVDATAIAGGKFTVNGNYGNGQFLGKVIQFKITVTEAYSGNTYVQDLSVYQPDIE